MIREDEPITNRFISLSNTGSFNPASFVSGIIRGVLDASGLPCAVSAILDGPADKTVFVVKFEEGGMGGAVSSS